MVILEVPSAGPVESASDRKGSTGEVRVQIVAMSAVDSSRHSQRRKMRSLNYKITGLGQRALSEKVIKSLFHGFSKAMVVRLRVKTK